MKNITSISLLIISTLFLASCSKKSTTQVTEVETGKPSISLSEDSKEITFVKESVEISRKNIEDKIKKILKSSISTYSYNYSDGCKTTDTVLQVLLQRTEKQKAEFTKYLTSKSTGDCSKYSDGTIEKPLVLITKMLNIYDGELCIKSISSIDKIANIIDCDGQEFKMDLNTGILTYNDEYNDSDIKIKVKVEVTQVNVSKEALTKDLQSINISHATSLGHGNYNLDSNQALENANAIEILNLVL